ncbi:MAG: hypothetical protein WC006_00005, partial [Bacilli bacterium]
NFNINKVIKDLERYEFRLILNYDTFNSINLDTFINNTYIKGIYSDLDLRDHQQYIAIFKVLNYEIITAIASYEYFNLKIISKEILKF